MSDTQEGVEKHLLVGLGNPGERYEQTRHNLGFMILEAFTRKKGWEFKKKLGLKGKIAMGKTGEKTFYLLFPLTYMNLSGEAVEKSLDFFKIPLDHLLVLSDDVALPYGVFRYRKGGSSGGHKGLESIEFHLGTKEYQRLRIGIGESGKESLEEYVLSPFLPEEAKHLPEVIEKGVVYIEEWIQKREITIK